MDAAQRERPLLSDAAARNARHIARFEAKPYPAPLPATAVTLGFEACAYPKIVRAPPCAGCVVQAPSGQSVRGDAHAAAALLMLPAFAPEHARNRQIRSACSTVACTPRMRHLPRLRPSMHTQVRELRHEDARIRRKAVLAARELLVAPQKLVQCIAAGVTPALIALLQVGSCSRLGGHSGPGYGTRARRASVRAWKAMLLPHSSDNMWHNVALSAGARGGPEVRRGGRAAAAPAPRAGRARPVAARRAAAAAEPGSRRQPAGGAAPGVRCAGRGMPLRVQQVRLRLAGEGRCSRAARDPSCVRCQHRLSHTCSHSPAAQPFHMRLVPPLQGGNGGAKGLPADTSGPSSAGRPGARDGCPLCAVRMHAGESEHA